jgi:phosphoserine phosphatase
MRLAQITMTTKESIKQEIDKLSEEQFQLVADFIEFIKFRTQKIDTSPQKRLSEFYGVLKATKPYPGKEEIRKIVGESLAQGILNEQ